MKWDLQQQILTSLYFLFTLCSDWRKYLATRKNTNIKKTGLLQRCEWWRQLAFPWNAAVWTNIFWTVSLLCTLKWILLTKISQQKLKLRLVIPNVNQARPNLHTLPWKDGLSAVFNLVACVQYSKKALKRLLKIAIGVCHQSVKTVALTWEMPILRRRR